MNLAVSGLPTLNIEEEPCRPIAFNLLVFVLHIVAFCAVMFILVAISPKAKAFTQIEDQVLIAVFEDHTQQVNSSMPYGLSWKLTEKAAETQNIELITIATTWQSGINRLKEGKLDLVFAAFRSQERSKWAQFTLPMVSDTSVLFSSIDSPVNTFENIDFEHETVGVVSNSTQETLARKVGFKHIYPAKERGRLYNLLESGRINYVLLGHSSFALYCKQDGPCVQQVGEPLADNYTRVMGMKDSERTSRIIKGLSEGIRAIYKDSETLDLFLAHGYSENYYEKWKAKLENEILVSMQVTATQ